MTKAELQRIASRHRSIPGQAGLFDLSEPPVPGVTYSDGIARFTPAVVSEDGVNGWECLPGRNIWTHIIYSHDVWSAHGWTAERKTR